MLPTVLLDLDVKGYCSIIGCVLKSEFYAALTGSHIMIPRIRTATGLKLKPWDLTVVTVRLDIGLTQAGHELKGQWHTRLFATVQCHGATLATGSYPHFIRPRVSMVMIWRLWLVTPRRHNNVTPRSAMRRQGRVTRQLRWRHLIVAEVQLCPEYKSSWRPPTCTR